MDSKLPESFRQYFWDVDFDSLEWQKAPQFVLKRIIDRGSLEAWQWASQRYTLQQVKDLMTTSRDLSRRTANFWAKILNLNPQEVPCLQKPYSPMPFQL